MFKKENVLKYDSRVFNPESYVYWVNSKGDNGCACTVEQFEKVKHMYKNELLIIAPQNIPLSFRKLTFN